MCSSDLTAGARLSPLLNNTYFNPYFTTRRARGTDAPQSPRSLTKIHPTMILSVQWFLWNCCDKFARAFLQMSSWAKVVCVTMPRFEPHLAPPKLGENDEASREPRAVSSGPGPLNRTVSPSKWSLARGSRPGTSAAKRSALKLAEDEGFNCRGTAVDWRLPPHRSPLTWARINWCSSHECRAVPQERATARGHPGSRRCGL